MHSPLYQGQGPLKYCPGLGGRESQVHSHLLPNLMWRVFITSWSSLSAWEGGVRDKSIPNPCWLFPQHVSAPRTWLVGWHPVPSATSYSCHKHISPGFKPLCWLQPLFWFNAWWSEGIIPSSAENNVSACCGDSGAFSTLKMTEPRSGRSLPGSGKGLHTKQMDPEAVWPLYYSFPPRQPA